MNDNDLLKNNSITVKIRLNQALYKNCMSISMSINILHYITLELLSQYFNIKKYIIHFVNRIIPLVKLSYVYLIKVLRRCLIFYFKIIFHISIQCTSLIKQKLIRWFYF